MTQKMDNNKQKKSRFSSTSLALTLALIAGGGGVTALYANDKAIEISGDYEKDSDNWGTTAPTDDTGKITVNGIDTTADNAKYTVTITDSGNVKKDLTVGIADKSQNITINNGGIIGAAGKKLTVEGNTTITINNEGAAANKGSIAADLELKNSIATINNSGEHSKISGAIKSSGSLTITNQNQAQITGAITSTAGLLNITNLTGSKITDNITATKTKQGSVINNSGEIGAAGKKIELTGDQDNKGYLTINNKAGGEIKSEITADANSVLVVNNAGNLDKIAAENTKGVVLNSTGGKLGAAVKLGEEAKITLSGTQVGDDLTAKENSSLTINKGGLGVTLADGKSITLNKGANVTINEGATLKGGNAAVSDILKLTDGDDATRNTVTNHGNLINEGSKKAGADLKAYTDFTNTGSITLDSLKIGAADYDNEGKSTITNTGFIGSETFSITGKNNTLNNSGEISALSINSDSTTINNASLGDIASLKIEGAAQDKNSKVTLNNAGSIGTLSLSGGQNKDGELTIVNNSGLIAEYTVAADGKGVLNINGNYAVDMSDYANTGGIYAEVEAGGSLDINLKSATRANGNTQFVLTGMTHGSTYDLSKFVKNDKAGTVNLKLNGSAITDLSSITDAQARGLFTTTQSIFDFNIANGNIVSKVRAERSLGSVAVFQNVAAFNSQVLRTTNMIDGVFDAISYGEMGIKDYPHAAGFSSKESVAMLKSMKAKKEQIEAEMKDEQKDAEVEEVVKELANKNGAYVSYLMPYYSATSMKPSTLGTTTNGSSFGFVGGITKESSRGILVGAHMAFDSSTYGKAGAEMQMQGSSYMVGFHTKVPLAQFHPTESLTLIPFVKGHINAMIAANTYRLTPLMNNTIEDTGITGGYSVDATFGLDIPTNFGYFAPELGFMHQAIFTPTLSWSGFTGAGADYNNQTAKATSAMPLYFLASVRYAKNFNIKDKAELFPTIKAGMRAIMAGGDYNTHLVLPGNPATANIFAANTGLDTVTGFVELGVGARFNNNVSVNLTYSGEFGKQVMTNTFFGRVGWQF